VVSWLMDGSSKQRCCCFKQRRERFLLFPSPLVFLFFLSSFVFQWFIPLYSRFIFLLNSLPYFKLPRNLSFLSLFRFLSFSILSVLLLFWSLSFSFLFLLCAGVESHIYKAKGSGGVLIAMRGERHQLALPRRRARQPMGVGLQGTSLLVSHHKGACVGLWFWQKHAGRERQEELKRKKNKSFNLPLLHVHGKKEEQCRSK